VSRPSARRGPRQDLLAAYRVLVEGNRPAASAALTVLEIIATIDRRRAMRVLDAVTKLVVVLGRPR